MSVPAGAPEQQTADPPAPAPSSFTSSVGKVKKGPYVDLSNILVGHSAPFIRRTNDMPYKLHVMDIIELVTGMGMNTCSKAWSNIKKTHSEFQNHDTAIFQGELGTPACLSFKLASQLILVLRGKTAENYRKLASDLVLKFLAQNDPEIAANLQAEKKAEQQQDSSMIQGCVQPATMSVEQGNKLFELEVRRRQISCEDGELEIHSKKARLELELQSKKARLELVLHSKRKRMAIKDAVNTAMGMDQLASLLSDGIHKKTVEVLVQNHKANFILRTTEHMATSVTGDVPPGSDSNSQAITDGPTGKFDVFKEGLPLQITTIMIEYKLVDNHNAEIAKAIGRIAARMYRDEFGKDPPKSPTVLNGNKVVEAFAYTNAHRKLLERACEEYIAKRDDDIAKRPKRKVHRALPR